MFSSAYLWVVLVWWVVADDGRLVVRPAAAASVEVGVFEAEQSAYAKAWVHMMLLLAALWWSRRAFARPRETTDRETQTEPSARPRSMDEQFFVGWRSDVVHTRMCPAARQSQSLESRRLCGHCRRMSG